MRRQHGIAVSLLALDRVHARELQLASETIRERLGLISQSLVLQHFLKTDHVGADVT
jgi:hypothetical protein